MAILDEGGEGALTFRALAARLATGSGAIYWHVTDKAESIASVHAALAAGVNYIDTAPWYVSPGPNILLT